MARIELTRELALAAGWDEANRSMRAAGRRAWNEEDAGIAAAEFNRLWPLCPHKVEPGECWLCDSQVDLIEGNKTVQRPLHVRDVTFKKAPRSRAEAAQNLTLNLGD